MKIRIIKGDTFIFNIESGCRQGSVESPKIFNVYWDLVLKIAAMRLKATANRDMLGIKVDFAVSAECTNRADTAPRTSYDNYVNDTVFADDLVIYTASEAELVEKLKNLNGVCKEFGLKMCMKKTKTMCFNTEENEMTKESLLTLDKEQISHVRNFVYLGHPINNTGKASFIGRRIGSASEKWRALESMLCDRQIYLKTRVKVAESCIRSRLCYALQALHSLRVIDLSKLESFWVQCLRKMINGGTKRKRNSNGEEIYSLYYTNKQIYSIAKTSNFTEFIKTQYLKYIGHVCRRPNQNLTKMVLFMNNVKKYKRNPWIKIAKMLNVSVSQVKSTTQNVGDFCELISRNFNNF